MVIARVTFPGPDQGGRQTPPCSGYHPQVALGNEYTSCVLDSLDGEAVFAFGRAHRVSLRLLFRERHPDAFVVGRSLRFYEGSHLVGSGVVLEIT